MIVYAFSFAIVLLALANATLTNSRNTLQAIELEKANAVGLQLDELAISLRRTLNDTDSDGFVESGLPVMWGTWPIGSGKPPVGMLPDTDPWGTPFAYCAWDNGSAVAGGRLVGAVDASRNVYAVISAGQNRRFDTECADLETGAKGKGDDQARAASQDVLVRGFGAKYWGDPVANAAQFPEDGEEGEIRLKQEDGKLYRYYDTTGWLKMAGLTVQPEGLISRYGAAMNGGMPQTVSMGPYMTGVIDGSGRVFTTGSTTKKDSWMPTVQSVVLQDTGITGFALGSNTFASGVPSAGYAPEVACPTALRLDGTFVYVNRTTAVGVPSCAAANYTVWADAQNAVFGQNYPVWLGGRALSRLVDTSAFPNGLPGFLVTSGGGKGTTIWGWLSGGGSGNYIQGLATGNVIDLAGPWTLTNDNMLAGPSPLGLVRAFSAGSLRPTNSESVMAIRTDGTLSVYGVDSQGAHGLGAAVASRAWTHNVLSGVRGVAHSGHATLGRSPACALAVMDDGRLLHAGNGCSHRMSLPAGTVWAEDATVPLVNGAKAVTGAWTNGGGVIIQLSNGTLWAKGQNDLGQLGVGHTNAVATWTRIL